MATPDTDISQLSETQQAALQQLLAVTGQEVDQAVPLLQRSQWSVEIAIAKFFDGEDDSLTTAGLAAQNVPPPRAPRQENLQYSLLNESSNRSRAQNVDSAPRIVPQPEDQVIRRPNLIFAILFAPFSVLYRIFSMGYRAFAFLFPFLPRFTPTGASNTMGRRSLKPRDAATRTKREFEEEYGPNNIPFFDGGYAQALDLAKKDLKFLIVHLMSPEHDDTSDFVHQTLLSEEVTSFLGDKTNNIIFWMGDVRDSEAYQVSSALRCTKFPFTALITHTPDQGATSMSVIARISGQEAPGAFVAKLQSAMGQHSEKLAAVRAQRSAQNFERTLREEQDSAYEQSLAQDRERARQRKEAEAAAAAEEKRRKEEEEAAAKLAENREQWKQWRVQSIQPEPEPGTSIVRVALRMPEGARVTRRFEANSGIEELYAFVECHDLLESGKEYNGQKPEGYEHKYNFRLVQSIPREVYEIEGGGQSGRELARVRT
ncbi:putative ubx domain protein [Botrytis fragariae]|uniref:Putative ubx domain protein n=1 Tax=Botrytis fragariae TaxID=1964551 RepID=A0A8H6ATG7_9HELO|nr:putative ubx domain protein [Botrytis fragariae]KAF5873306.1 putative ubx domain protein [Botrytis fragariae]